MNRLERLMWSIRGDASQWVVEEIDDPIDAVTFPLLFWALAGALAYAGVDLYTSGSGFIPLVALAIVSTLFAKMAIVATLASKYYLTEWTEDVRPPEVSR